MTFTGIILFRCPTLISIIFHATCEFFHVFYFLAFANCSIIDISLRILFVRRSRIDIVIVIKNYYCIGITFPYELIMIMRSWHAECTCTTTCIIICSIAFKSNYTSGFFFSIFVSNNSLQTIVMNVSIDCTLLILFINKVIHAEPVIRTKYPWKTMRIIN